jgi:hypothetical protein
MLNTRGVRALAIGLGALAAAIFVAETNAPAHADSTFTGFVPGNLVVSRSTYAGVQSTVTVGEILPPICGTSASCTGVAIDDGHFPSVSYTNNVWNNDTVDGSFGVTSPIYLDQMTTGGQLVSTLPIDPTHLVTSFSSKSELALNLSTDGTVITFMGYVAPVNTLDASNANTPGVYDATNPVGSSYYRAVAEVNASGNLQISDSNAYSGNNGRAAIKANGLYYTVGNSNNGSGTPANVVAAAGLQYLIPYATPSAPTQLGSFSLLQTNPYTGLPYGPTADKAGKDNNFRGLSIFNNTLYITKGSGSNGINTVYYVGTPGSLPPASAAPTVPINVLPGFNAVPNKTNTDLIWYPFGIWFANANTLYVADEGDGTIADASTSTTAGLQKWSLVGGVWQLDYVLQKGLNLGVQYGVAGYPTSINPATDGLRNLTGRVNTDGTVTIWAVTSTVSNNGDQGADPNKLVMIADVLANTTASGAANESFVTLETAGYGEVLRGVAFTPGTLAPPAPASLPVTSGAVVYSRVSKTYSVALTVLNNTSSAVTGPYYIVLNSLSSGVTLTNGTTLGGVPAIQVLASGASLNPGQSASVTAIFSDPTAAAITYNAVAEP